MKNANVITLVKALLISAEERGRMIAEMAYYLAEQRGFQGGEDKMSQDWLEAERRIDQLLKGGNAQNRQTVWADGDVGPQ